MSTWAVPLAIAVSSALFWAIVLITLNRGSDRIQLATVCLVVCMINYVGIAWKLHDLNGGATPAVAGIGVYIATLYVGLGILAIDHKRWAWRLAIASFAAHLIYAIPIAVQLRNAGLLGGIGVIQWVLPGAIGFFACRHEGSKALLTPSHQAAA